MLHKLLKTNYQISKSIIQYNKFWNLWIILPKIFLFSFYFGLFIIIYYYSIIIIIILLLLLIDYLIIIWLLITIIYYLLFIITIYYYLFIILIIILIVINYSLKNEHNNFLDIFFFLFIKIKLNLKNL